MWTNDRDPFLFSQCYLFIFILNQINPCLYAESECDLNVKVYLLLVDVVIIGTYKNLQRCFHKLWEAVIIYNSSGDDVWSQDMSQQYEIYH